MTRWDKLSTPRCQKFQRPCSFDARLGQCGQIARAQGVPPCLWATSTTESASWVSLAESRLQVGPLEELQVNTRYSANGAVAAALPSKEIAWASQTETYKSLLQVDNMLRIACQKFIQVQFPLLLVASLLGMTAWFLAKSWACLALVLLPYSSRLGRNYGHYLQKEKSQTNWKQAQVIARSICRLPTSAKNKSWGNEPT